MKKLLLFVGLVLGCGLLVYFFKNADTGQEPTQTVAGDTSVGLADLGLFYNWVIGRGDLANKIRKVTTEPLIEVIEPDHVIMRVASAASYQEDSKKGTIAIRNDVYWSDGTPLISQQFIDAFAMAKTKYVENQWKVSEVEERWLRNLNLEVISSTEFSLQGFWSQTDFQNFLVHQISLPVRKDLWKIDNPLAGWDVTIGSHIPLFPETIAEKLKEITLKPNPRYYRGSRKENVSFGLKKEPTAVQ